MARDQRGPEAGKAFLCIAQGAFATSAFRGTATACANALRCGQESGSHEKAQTLEHVADPGPWRRLNAFANK